MASDERIRWSMVTSSDGLQMKSEVGSYIGSELKTQVSIIALWYFVGLQIFATVGLPMLNGTITQAGISIAHATVHVCSPESWYPNMMGFTSCTFIVCCLLGKWLDGHLRTLWISRQSEAVLIKMHAQAQLSIHKSSAEKAQAQATSFGQVVSGTAHDLRTPVSAIQSGEQCCSPLSPILSSVCVQVAGFLRCCTRMAPMMKSHPF